MDKTTVLDRLHFHQCRALDVLSRGSDMLASGDVGDRPALRAEMAAALRDYQVFKHEEIFDPAVASGSAERARLGRAMKIECIAAGETFRTHTQRWKDDAVAADPGNYRVAARLTLNALRRHVEQEGEGIARLLALLDGDVARRG